MKETLHMRHIRGQIADRRGIQSENKVAQVVSTMPNVISITQSPKWSHADMAGIDAVVTFKNPDTNQQDVIDFQVKSSEHAKDRFVRRKKKRLGLSTEGQVWNRFVIVNGQRSHADIRKSVTSQLEDRGILVDARHRFGEPKPVMPHQESGVVIDAKDRFFTPKPGENVTVFEAPKKIQPIRKVA